MLEQIPIHRTDRKKRATISADQAANLHSAWCTGKAKTVSCDPSSTIPDWKKGIKNELVVEQALIVNQGIFYASKARQLAAQGDYSASIQLFAIAQRAGDDPRLDRQSRLLCISEIQAAEAYLDFVTGDFSGARKRLLAAMTADESLEQEFGHRVLHIHRIHLANNLVKVESGAGNLTFALELAADILNYVHRKAESIKLPSQWGRDWTAALEEEPTAFLTKQTTVEVACAMAGWSGTEIQSSWMLHFEVPPMRAGSGTPDEVVDWYAIKTAFLRCMDSERESTSAFCRMASRYLAEGPRYSRLLWDMVCFDILLLSARSSSTGALLLQAELTQALTAATHLPRQVRAKIVQAAPIIDTRCPQQLPA